MMLSNGSDILEDLVCMKQGVKEKTMPARQEKFLVFKKKKKRKNEIITKSLTLIVKLIIDN